MKYYFNSFNYFFCSAPLSLLTLLITYIIIFLFLILYIYNFIRIFPSLRKIFKINLELEHKLYVNFLFFIYANKEDIDKLFAWVLGFHNKHPDIIQNIPVTKINQNDPFLHVQNSISEINLVKIAYFTDEEALKWSPFLLEKSLRQPQFMKYINPAAKVKINEADSKIIVEILHNPEIWGNLNKSTKALFKKQGIDATALDYISVYQREWLLLDEETYLLIKRSVQSVPSNSILTQQQLMEIKAKCLNDWKQKIMKTLENIPNPSLTTLENIPNPSTPPSIEVQSSLGMSIVDALNAFDMPIERLPSTSLSSTPPSIESTSPRPGLERLPNPNLATLDSALPLIPLERLQVPSLTTLSERATSDSFNSLTKSHNLPTLKKSTSVDSFNSLTKSHNLPTLKKSTSVDSFESLTKSHNLPTLKKSTSVDSLDFAAMKKSTSVDSLESLTNWSKNLNLPTLKKSTSLDSALPLSTIEGGPAKNSNFLETLDAVLKTQNGGVPTDFDQWFPTFIMLFFTNK